MIGAGAKFFNGSDVNAGAGTVAAVLARNGVSLDPASTLTHPIVVLGDSAGGSLAKFLSARFINENGFPLNFIDVGDPATNAPGIVLMDTAARRQGLAPLIVFATAAALK